ncbi:MAG: tRNA pseudouridine(38-40) synthase TruA [Candidatus Neomarinimicrobiota bacterium]|jgi:tRNA pseudouridine38-40 synthase|nr:tRNA pseudouridine(38-40) synthase TruA [Candidatus Neomarinimicrobiota bacterium]MDD3965848.1 tRNA pseudouridine(38-40) synthase TruA [Candidatus Neomarinimicrobiota bacterium]MDX9779982.1 tRNA pseudouridine(38-40) synthase TruA [bacterium]
MNRIVLLIEYDGTAYAGFQLQPDMPSIQGELENVLARIYQTPVRIIPSGRTDTGVHALYQVVHFDPPRELQRFNPKAALNSLLPSDIRIRSYCCRDGNFHARYSAKERRYRYVIRQNETALERDRAWQCFLPLDLETLQTCAAFLTGEHDFTSFCSAQAETEHKRCIIFHSEWKRENDRLVYDIYGNRFLHSMVRSLVGTMVEAARGRISSGEFLRILQARDRISGAVSAPPQGLYLMYVAYDPPLDWEKEL